jgi:hypothetical protein
MKPPSGLADSSSTAAESCSIYAVCVFISASWGLKRTTLNLKQSTASAHAAHASASLRQCRPDAGMAEASVLGDGRTDARTAARAML